jgi:basic membrane protein A
MNNRIMMFSRRAVLAGGAVLAGSRFAVAQRPLKIAALFAGNIADKGFMQAGYEGLLAARGRLNCSIAWTDGIKPERAALENALRELAKASPDLVIAHGGQNNAAAQTVAGEFPSTKFVVTQGDVVGANLASYEVLQEHSAFLAGALAAMTTKTGVVGHMSGIRVTPGLKGRAAYAHGVRHVSPTVELLTNFSGNQDDNALSRRVASAMADRRADVIFTMLNAGRTGAIEVCRERKIAQIGNVRDWVADMPDVFIGSAIAASGLAVFAAAEDAARDKLQLGKVMKIGLERPEAVRLTVGATVGPEIRAQLAALTADIVAGRLEIATNYAGVEFANPA